MNHYVVSMTTIPSKFDLLSITIDSLLRQTYSPLKIIIHIPYQYHFRLKGAHIPLEKIETFLTKYPRDKVIINPIETDFGPGTKLLGLLDSPHLLQDIDLDSTFILLVDDDLIYQPYMIELFQSILEHTPIQVASYYVYSYHQIPIGQGADGFFIRYSLLHRFCDYFNIIKQDSIIQYHDDFYISYYFYLLKETIYPLILPSHQLIYEKQPNSSIDALSQLQGYHDRQHLNRTIYDLLQHYSDHESFNKIIKRQS